MHKVQGSSVRKAIIAMSSPRNEVFQLYTAVSRSESLDNIIIGADIEINIQVSLATTATGIVGVLVAGKPSTTESFVIQSV